MELLEILSTHTLVHGEKVKTQYVSNMFKGVMSRFVQRFKNFGELNAKEISDLNIITELLEKLDTGKTYLENTQEPSKTDQENTQNPSETDLVNTQEPSTPELDIKELLALTESATVAVLNLAGEEDVEEWKNNSLFKFKNFQTDQNKEYYMNLLTYNADAAYSLVGSFEKKFLDGINYKKIHNGGNELVFV